MRVLAKDIAKLTRERAGAEVELKGWVHRIRELGAVSFILLRDRSGIVQLVLESKPELSLESVIAVKGTLSKNEKASGGAEVKVQSMTVIAAAAPDLPYPVNADPDKLGLDVILDKRSLSLRNPKIRSIFRVQAVIMDAFSEYLRSQDFTEIKTSKLIGSGTEGGTGLFEVEYFDRKVYLAQSPQFYKQMLVASGMERVFEIAPAYRAEKHDTPRHLNEYVSMDVEMGFIETEKDLIDLERSLLAHIFGRVASECTEELALWNATVPETALIKKAPLVAHDQALEIASKEAAGKRFYEINPEAERLLCLWAAREHGIELVFVNEFPRRHRPFYTYPLNKTHTMSFDALFRGLEITTGGRRHNVHAELLEVLPRFGLSEEALKDYLDIFKYGCPPHGGFAIGCERLTQKILGLSNIKEASLFPRDRKRVSP